MTARDEILGRVRTALAVPRDGNSVIAAEHAGIPREYQAASVLTAEERIELLCDRLLYALFTLHSLTPEHSPFDVL